MLATVLEEMPPFPEKESSGLLNLLKKKRPGRVPDNPEIRLGDNDAAEARDKARKAASAAAAQGEDEKLSDVILMNLVPVEQLT